MDDPDVTFRDLLCGLPRPILRLAFPRRRLDPLGPLEPLGPLDPLDPAADRPPPLPQLPQPPPPPRQPPPPQAASRLLRVRDGDIEVAVHIQIDPTWRPELPGQLFARASATAVATGLPTSSIAVLLRPGGHQQQQQQRGAGLYRIRGIGGDSFVFRYHVVPLWRLDARRMRRQLGLEGAPFCAAMQGADERFVRALADEVRGDRELPEPDRQRTMQLLYVMSAIALDRDTAERIFHAEPIAQDPAVQALLPR